MGAKDVTVWHLAAHSTQGEIALPRMPVALPLRNPGSVNKAFHQASQPLGPALLIGWLPSQVGSPQVLVKWPPTASGNSLVMPTEQQSHFSICFSRNPDSIEQDWPNLSYLLTCDLKTPENGRDVMVKLVKLGKAPPSRARGQGQTFQTHRH